MRNDYAYEKFTSNLRVFSWVKIIGVRVFEQI
jgi:hypothetical protein